MLKAEDDILSLKNANSELNSNNQQNCHDATQLQEQVNQLELELTISQEKHRTCQKEVNNQGMGFFYAEGSSFKTLRQTSLKCDGQRFY